MKTLNTYGEVLIALGEGREIIDSDSSLWVFKHNKLFRDGTSGQRIENISLPCTIKEEPEYLYEVERYQEIITLHVKNPEKNTYPEKIKTGEFNVIKEIIKSERIEKYHVKTGRKFIIENGIPVEVK